MIVLLGYFVNVSGLAEFRSLMLQWSVLVAGIAVMIGVGNLFSVHLQKITERKPGALYSVFLLAFFLMTFFIVVTASSSNAQVLIDIQNIFLNGIMIPV